MREVPLYRHIAPFIDAITSPETTGPMTAAALASCDQFIKQVSADYSQVDMLGLRYTFVNFGAGKGPGRPNGSDQIDCHHVPGDYWPETAAALASCR